MSFEDLRILQLIIFGESYITFGNISEIVVNLMGNPFEWNFHCDL